MVAAAMPLAELEQWLQDRADRRPVATSLPTLDGYIAAIVAGPVSIDPLEWICPLLAVDAGGCEIGCQIAGIGSKRVAASGVDQDSAAILLHEEGGHRRARIPFGGHALLSQQPSDLRGRRTVQVIGKDGHESVVKRRDQQLTNPDLLKSRRLATARNPSPCLLFVDGTAVDVHRHNS